MDSKKLLALLQFVTRRMDELDVEFKSHVNTCDLDKQLDVVVAKAKLIGRVESFREVVEEVNRLFG